MLQDLLDCTVGDGCQGQFHSAYVDLIGCVGIALERDGPYRVADGGQDKCKPLERRYSAMSHGQGGEYNASQDGVLGSAAPGSQPSLLSQVS